MTGVDFTAIFLVGAWAYSDPQVDSILTHLNRSITAQLVAARDGPATLITDKRRPRNTTLIIGTLFLATVAICIFEIITRAKS